MTANPARPPSATYLCDLSDIAEPGTRGFRFRVGEALFAGFVLRFEGEIRGYVDSCPHAGWPLSALDDRYLTRDGRRILCAGHGALFRPLDGMCTSGPCHGEALTPWPVALVDGRIVTA